MSAHATLPPTSIVLFALSGIGIAFIALSRSVAAKRIVLPLTLVAFHVVVFMALEMSPGVANIRPVIIVAALAANAILTWWIVTYCTTCGRTIARGSGGRCPACARRNE